ncbi:MAG TPA: nucleotidyl transferase AbiEii/AbiGii toxin family protein, partial [Dyadobacter sp.]|jgi:predicted nucleotidyltransferase component of viral defense system|nr:nucleotidyl transferase AbiEii/AbiGii toxin family protein [Dyadobacter sp.]
MIKDWLAEYNPSNQEDATQALREIMQEVALAGLYRKGFFEKAAFYGGTALRIFYGLDRYSKDLDFSLLDVNPDFSINAYLAAISDEFEALGMHVSIREKQKTKQSSIDSAFLKSEKICRELVLESIVSQHGLGQIANIKIKLEVDTMPPLHFQTEERLVLKPFSFYVKCFSLPDLFAGKMHALLFRKWKNNVKGRDWYDLEWYIRKGVSLDLKHFLARARDSGDWENEDVTQQELQLLLSNKIDEVNFGRIKDDIRRFIPDERVLDIWTAEYFHQLISKLKVADV